MFNNLWDDDGWGGWWDAWVPLASETPPEHSDPTSRRVELFINEQWVDVTAHVYERDAIRIVRGRQSETTGRVDPCTCSLTLNNRDGRYSPRNPSSPYYGQLGRNTPMRVSVMADGTRWYRFYGEVPEWPLRWDISGTDVWVTITAAGITRRLTQGSSPLRSALYRELTNPTRTSIVAYWPCEDGSGSTTIGAGFDGAAAMAITGGTATLATFSDYIASDALPTLGTATFTGQVPSYAETGETSLRVFVYSPSAVAAATRIASLITTGTAARWDLWVDTSGNLKLTAQDEAGTQILSTGYVSFAITGDQVHLVVALTESGSDVDYVITEHNITDAVSLSGGGYSLPTTEWSGTLSSYTVGTVERVIVAPDGGLGDTAVGHVTLASDTSAYAFTGSAMIGWGDENPNNRLARLCREEEISYHVVNHGLSTGNATTMGTQTTSNLVDLLNECAETDLGLLYEPRDQVGFEYRSRLSMYNQTSVMTLTHSAHELAAPLEPVDDDQLIRNDVTVSRERGSSVRVVQTTGALSTAAPPDGVGRYDTQVSISLGQDTQLADQAYWRLRHGTVDEPRYPKVAVNLRHSTFANDAAMLRAALAVEIGDQITVDGLPAWLPPDDVDLIVVGYTERIAALEHTLEFVCTTGTPWQVATVDTDRYDTAGSSLTSEVDADDTSLSVTTSTGPLWTTDTSMLPLNIRVGGETMTVTEIHGADGTFESGVADWTGTSCTTAQSSAQAYRGTYSCLMTVSGSPSQAYFRPVSGEQAAVTAGTSYTLTLWAYSVAGVGNFLAAVDWFDIGGTYLSTSTSSATTLTAATWTEVTVTDTAPAGATQAYYGPTLSSSPAAGTAVYVDFVVFSTPAAQTFTVTRSANGVSQSHAAGTAVALDSTPVRAM